MIKEKDKTPSYTNINHNKRIKLGLTLTEYCIADSIDKLSNNAKQKWCTMSRPNMGNFVGISARQTTRLVQKLSQMGFVEIDEDTDFVRSTERWTNEVVLEPMTTCHPPDKMSVTPRQSVSLTPDKMSHNNNTNNNINNISKKPEQSIEFLRYLPEDFIEEIHAKFDITRSNIKLTADRMLDWCQSKGKKYKDYKAAMRNWIRDKYPERRLKMIELPHDTEPDPQVVEMLNKIKNSLKITE